MKDYDVYFKEPSGSHNHTIISTNCLSEAAKYVESTKGVDVYKVEERETSSEHLNSMKLE